MKFRTSTQHTGRSHRAIYGCSLRSSQHIGSGMSRNTLPHLTHTQFFTLIHHGHILDNDESLFIIRISLKRSHGSYNRLRNAYIIFLSQSSFNLLHIENVRTLSHSRHRSMGAHLLSYKIGQFITRTFYLDLFLHSVQCLRRFRVGIRLLRITRFQGRLIFCCQFSFGFLLRFAQRLTCGYFSLRRATAFTFRSFDYRGNFEISLVSLRTCSRTSLHRFIRSNSAILLNSLVLIGIGSQRSRCCLRIVSPITIYNLSSLRDTES
ncbi:hypothetical protein EVA_03660 [gut metagenome]|uniref:Uncharacterized protein n=1 Tax=gut metagenome TaxID=749906 RepID=J9H3I5_9ZZZZ